MGYSRYGRQGKGLSDRGYARWVTGRAKSGKSTVVSNPLSYLFGMASLGTPVGWVGKTGWSGSYAQRMCDLQAQHPGKSISQIQGMAGIKQIIPKKKATSTQFGAITTGRSRGYPSWMIGMVNKARASEDTGGNRKLPMGLALVTLKVLL